MSCGVGWRGRGRQIRGGDGSEGRWCCWVKAIVRSSDDLQLQVIRWGKERGVCGRRWIWGEKRVCAREGKGRFNTSAPLVTLNPCPPPSITPPLSPPPLLPPIQADAPVWQRHFEHCLEAVLRNLSHQEPSIREEAVGCVRVRATVLREREVGHSGCTTGGGHGLGRRRSNALRCALQCHSKRARAVVPEERRGTLFQPHLAPGRASLSPSQLPP